MSFAPPHPISAEAASPVSLPPLAAGVADGRPRAGVRSLSSMLLERAAFDRRHLQIQPRAPAQPVSRSPTIAPGLRLLPAAAFHWSDPRGMPRTRGEHVLILLAAGSAVLRLPRSEVTASPLLFLPAGTAFAWHPGPDAEGVVLLIGRDLAEAAATPLPSGMIDAAPDATEFDELEAALAALAAEMLREDAGARKATEAQLGRLAQRLSRTATAEPAGDALAHKFVALAARELPRGRNVDELAAALGCEPTRLDRACEARHGKRAAEVLQSLRITRAVELLEVTRLPLQEITRQAGFAEPSQMTRAVCAATGRQPEELRPA